MIDLKQGDCLELMRSMDENSVDSIVTDSPYGISFMGKKWDYDVPSVEIWKECLRVLKPGGHLLAFAGTRTQHRMCCNIEDAGFEIRDMIAWVYGSGFPKSHNIGKAVDKLQGNKREEVWNDRYKDGHTRKTGDSSNWALTSHAGSGGNGNITTKGSSEWEGWGTALKPALEPITVARKPLSEKTVAANVLKWGTGGINIDGCRVKIPESDKENYEFNNNGLSRMKRPEGDKLGQFDGGWKIDKTKRETPIGRFPANFIHDGDQFVLDLFPNSKGQQGNLVNHNKDRESPNGIFGKMSSANDHLKRNDSGSAARFFYCAKASKKDRNEGCEDLEDKHFQMRPFAEEGCDKSVLKNRMNSKSGKNNHPTVKPTKLMRYLCRLVTPKGGTVLDPFMGSGSTGKACVKENFSFIGMELDKDYFDIAKSRILTKS